MKKFLKPEIEFVKFSNKDVISTSGQFNLPDGPDINPQSDSPAKQSGWSTPTFNK